MGEIARRAGVSKATVSRVLNGKPDVDAGTAARIQQIVAEAAYVPSARAVGLARGRTRTVGMLVPSLTWPWMADVLQGVVDELEINGYGLLLYTISRGEESLSKFAGHVSSKTFDGLIVIEPPNTLDYITQLHQRGLPVVLIDDRGHHPEFPSVATTNYAGGASAAEHFALDGRRHVATVTGPNEFGCTRARATGFRSRLQESGLELSADLVVEGDFTEQGGYDGATKLLISGQRIDAIFAHNDLMAIGVQRALSDAHRSIPSAVAVIGFDDIPLAAHTTPSLTTVRQPLREMGQVASRLLMSRFEGATLPDEPVVLPTSLVVRRSAPAAPTTFSTALDATP